MLIRRSDHEQEGGSNISTGHGFHTQGVKSDFRELLQSSRGPTLVVKDADE